MIPLPRDPLEDSSAGPQAPQEFLPESLRGTFLFGAPRYAARLNRPVDPGLANGDLVTAKKRGLAFRDLDVSPFDRDCHRL